MKFRNTIDGIVNFREEVRQYAYECARYAEAPLTDELLQNYRDDYLSNMEFEDEEDYEEAIFQFDIAFRQGWQAALKEEE